MDNTNSLHSLEVDLHEISIEETKFQRQAVPAPTPSSSQGLAQAQAQIPAGNARPVRRERLEAAFSRTNQSEESKRATLLRLLRSSIKGKLITGDTAADMANVMQENPVFKHVAQLNSRRLLNESNSALDFGDKPMMIGAKGAQQKSGAFVVPHTTPTRLVVEYAECEPRFNDKGCYESSKLCDHGITQREFSESVTQANETLMPLRGLATRTEIYSILILGIGLLLVLTAGILLGYFVSYYITLAMCVVYIAFLVVFILCIRRRNSRLLVHSHVALALLVRCLNNRLYLRHKVLVRPGYLGKWLEFNMIPAQNLSTDT
jgi:hypothetical protein